ncbi:hypothetical protein QTP70_011156 [Hemibagrus guttatus]|uniref:ribonuclease H n=1 Tax=Hemibagrus guttatus TaxID=175788 RepID=A0AAE0VAU0_9TELE|nr:hypothetical protein QTP70_011156 [Hemibagrus guttatus]
MLDMELPSRRQRGRPKRSTNFIPDRSRPGLPTIAIGAVDLQGAGRNWATVGGRSRGGRRVRRQREKRKGKSVGLRIGTLNVGTMTGKGRELADMMERRKVDILCVQETRWKGSKARSIGAGFKLFYYGVDSKKNGVGVVLKEEFVRNVLEVKRVSDRVMSLKLEIEGVMLNVVSGYAPQVGCELEEKERFWSELDEVMESIPTGERVVIGADFNGHVGEGNTGDEEVMGKFGVKERNLEGQMVVDFAKRMDMGVVNTYFQKMEEHRVTYKSGGRRTQVDYILCRRDNLKEISDCKVVVGESVARQHRMVVCRMTLMVCKKKRQKLRQALGGQVVLPDDWETTAEVIRETGRKVLGVSSGRRKEDKETWWWNEEVQDSIQRKRLAKKKWDMDRTEENRQEYKELQRRVKREVSKAKQKAYDELYTRLDTREGEKDLYRLARQRDRDGKDVQQVRVIKDRDGRVLTSEESVQRRWKEYFEELMNEENEREKRVEGVNSVEQKVDKIRKNEVRKALKRMKSGKAVGPDDIPVEVWKCLGEAAVEFLASLFNRVLESERMPEEWRRSVLVPIFKNKGDVQSCSNYRGIKLMSHTMKLWERVVEARLRKVVEICEQQYGFMPRKSTTDAIFALRILMEKYRDGQRELHCVFVDLEKAYDRVPREELWYCMRKSGVAEKYVRVVQDMYERSRTVVRCAVGQTEEFKVEVGLHQGSALSPFLFAIVMDQLSEEVRQESPWTMMFADDIVICSESREQVEENLERWRFALERRGMKVSRSKTEYMCVNEREGSGTVRLQREEVKKVQEFKYLGSTVQSNGECGKEVKKRVQAGWNGWRKVWGVLCDRKISARIKGKVYRTVVRPAMLYGLETVSLRKRQESELEVAELKMLRFSLGVTRLDRIRNEYIRGTAHVGRLGDKVRETRLRWFGHVQRRENDLVLLSPTEEALQQNLHILHSFSQTWALTINPTKTKVLTFQKRPRGQGERRRFTLGVTKTDHVTNETYLGLKFSANGNLKLAVDELREKARRAFCAIKKSIPVQIPVRIWLKIFHSVIEPIAPYGSEVWDPLLNQEFHKWDKNPVEALHAEFCKSILREILHKRSQIIIIIIIIIIIKNKDHSIIIIIIIIIKNKDHSIIIIIIIIIIKNKDHSIIIIIIIIKNKDHSIIIIIIIIIIKNKDHSIIIIIIIIIIKNKDHIIIIIIIKNKDHIIIIIIIIIKNKDHSIIIIIIIIKKIPSSSSSSSSSSSKIRITSSSSSSSSSKIRITSSSSSSSSSSKTRITASSSSSSSSS